MESFVVTPTTTVRGTAPAVISITQEEEHWFDAGHFSDIALFIYVADIAVPAFSGGSVSLEIESAPTHDESLFQLAYPAIALVASASPIVRRTVRTPSTAPLSRWLRVRVDVPGGSSGAWSATYRILGVPLRTRAFVPPDITGCALWLRSDLGVTAAGVPLVVSKWADQSGNGRDATAAGAQQPSYTVSSINNLPSLDFDGVGNIIATAGFSLGAYTMLMVTTGQDPAKPIGYFFTRSTGAPGVSADTIYGTTTNTSEVSRGGTLSAYDHVATWSRWGANIAKVLVQLFDGTHAGHKVRLNTTPIALNSVSAGDPGTGTHGDQLVVAGRNDAFLPSKIKVAEVIVYDTALGNTDLARVEQYLRRRYALF